MRCTSSSRNCRALVPDGGIGQMPSYNVSGRSTSFRSAAHRSRPSKCTIPAVLSALLRGSVLLVRVLIASPLEAELVQRIQAVDARLDVVYRADLLAEQRYPGDHHPPIQRSPAHAAEWADLLAQAEV